MIQACVCTTTRKANRALFRYYEKAMNGTGLTIVQFSILRALDRNGPTTLSSLAEELVMERTSLYRTIKALAEREAVSIEGTGEGREKRASITQNGQILMTGAAPAWEQAQNTIITKIGPDMWQALSAKLLEIPEILKDAHD